MSFAKEFVRHPRVVGAVCPSSPALARRMAARVPFEQARCVVELGAGTGAFTEVLVRRRRPGTVLVVFEINVSFARELQARYGRERGVYIIADSAENMELWLRRLGFDEPDAIVSGLPFLSLPRQCSRQILSACRDVLKPDGVFVTFQYTRLMLPLLREYFPAIEQTRERRNVPPAYVLRCRKH